MFRIPINKCVDIWKIFYSDIFSLWRCFLQEFWDIAKFQFLHFYFQLCWMFDPPNFEVFLSCIDWFAEFLFCFLTKVIIETLELRISFLLHGILIHFLHIHFASIFYVLILFIIIFSIDFIPNGIIY